MCVVAGVTGQTGSVVAQTLLARGASVRVIVREVTKGKEWATRGAEQAIALPEAEWSYVLGQMQMNAHAVLTWTEMLRGFNSGLITFADKGAIKIHGQISIEEAVAAAVHNGKTF